MGTLDNKIAIVTGSSSGIGKTVAIAFAQEGANLVLNYPNDSQLQNVTQVKDAIAALGRQVIPVQITEDSSNCVVLLNHGPALCFRRVCGQYKIYTSLHEVADNLLLLYPRLK